MCSGQRSRRTADTLSLSRSKPISRPDGTVLLIPPQTTTAGRIEYTVVDDGWHAHTYCRSPWSSLAQWHSHEAKWVARETRGSSFARWRASAGRLLCGGHPPPRASPADHGLLRWPAANHGPQQLIRSDGGNSALASL